MSKDSGTKTKTGGFKGKFSGLKKPRTLLIISLTFNVLFVLYIIGGFIFSWYLDRSGVLDYAYYNAMHRRLCEERYEEHLRRIEHKYGGNQERAAEENMTFALLICGRNYKNGEKLDFRLFLDQINNTPPKTNFR